MAILKPNENEDRLQVAADVKVNKLPICEQKREICCVDFTTAYTMFTERENLEAETSFISKNILEDALIRHVRQE